MAKILIIDDANFSRFMISKIIMAAGHEVIEAENGLVGLAKIETEKPDLVVTDLLMPEVDGVELLTRLNKKQNNIPVIVVSSNIQQIMQQKCLDLGAAGFINKPPQKEVISQLIDKILK